MATMSTNIVVMLVTRGQQRQPEITILKSLKVPVTFMLIESEVHVVLLQLFIVKSRE